MTLTPPTYNPDSMVETLHTYDLGRHELAILEDSTFDIVDQGIHDPAHNCESEEGVRLDTMEAYRLYLALQEWFRSGVQQPDNSIA